MLKQSDGIGWGKKEREDLLKRRVVEDLWTPLTEQREKNDKGCGK